MKRTDDRPNSRNRRGRLEGTPHGGEYYCPHSHASGSIVSVLKEHQKLQETVDSVLLGKPRPRVLEAGCGSLSHVRFPADTQLVGIDISQGQLDRNKGLHERILGDVQTYQLEPESFDGIVCWDVLEHLEAPEKALERFSEGIRAGGVIILSAPNPLSTKGLVTKLTPYVFHLWFYRKIRGWKQAGTAGNPPFPTYLRLSMAPKSIERFAARQGLHVLYRSVAGYGDSRDVMGRKSRKVDMVMVVLNSLLRVLSLGTIQPEATQLYFVLQKPPAASSA